ncbi:hypothetical protein AAG570_013755 [Ranatra chinensis]|uniref:P-type domain-containing protein n=1 Tax=Ranatra chinensis TaxID=642074 RepID=A0ABD0YD42_9HEMI
MYFEHNLSNTDRIESGEEEIGVEQSLPYPPVPDPSTCVNIEDGLKFDCFPRGQVTEKDCNQRGCCYTNITINRDPKVPICYYPKTYNSYKYTNITIKDWGIVATMAAQFRSPYPKDSVNLVLHIIYIDENTVYIKMNTTGNTKNQNMWPLADDPVPKIGVKSAFDVKIDMNSTGFQVMRKSNGKIIFDTKNLGGFIHTDQFFQISSKLPSKFIYGLGEQRSSFLRDVNWNTISLFTHDSIPLDNVNGYGFHPVYLCMEGGGLSHGVVSLNSYPTDIILQPGPAITFRTIGGILAFVIFMGPTPIDVVKQYTSVVNQRAPIPPYWALGFHLCRFGYKSLADVEKIWNQTVEAGIPLDTQWADLDYMKNRNDFTLDDKFKGLDKFVDKLHKKGMHFVPLVDPGISGSETPGTYPPYDDGMNLKIFVMDSSGKKPFIGKVWNSKTTLFPDFTHPRIIEYWFNQLKRFHDMVPFDGAWIDMNEPSNFLNGSLTGCPNNNWEHPPYVPTVDGGFLSYRTLCMSSLHWNGVKHYDIHNLYGTMEMIVTSFTMGMLRNSRPFVISRSSAPSLGNYGGHWTGDVRSTWDDMKHSVADLFSFSLFGVPLVGADICGFNGNTSVDLCQRWSQLGAFYPFSRNHNSDDTIAQDPVSLGDAVASAAKKALKIRYMLLPYLYTLFADNANDRTPVVQPLFFQFPEDAETYSIMTQFMWGRSLLFAPVLEEGMTYVKVYLPKGVWYNGYTKERILSKGQYFATPAPLDTIPIFTRGGSIIPEQIPGQTTTERYNPIMSSGFETFVQLG